MKEGSGRVLTVNNTDSNIEGRPESWNGIAGAVQVPIHQRSSPD
jgi:hypothetical protein